jgi:hypothetical protein
VVVVGAVPVSPPLFLPVDVTDGIGVLDIRWDDICATFEGLYISWNPSLFGSHVTFHGRVFTSHACVFHTLTNPQIMAA